MAPTREPAAGTVPGRPGLTAAAAGLLPVLSVVAVDPGGLAPHGPLR